MTERPVLVRDTILAVDIGATTTKFAAVDDEGRLVEEVLREPTPYPCTPERLVDFVLAHVERSGCARIGVGFPGDLRDGRVLEPGNLSRPGGFTSPIDPALHEEWQGTDLELALREASGLDVRVVNDATLAALGCCEGRGRELVFTLGTGFGIALVVDDVNIRIRDVGDEVFLDGASYDGLLGDHARSQDEGLWNDRLHMAVTNFVAEFSADVAHLGGGNSRRVDIARYEDQPWRVVVNDNVATLRGAAKLFR
ncbi:MAG: ROK family protein [Acidimicrobiales bacterium]|jgi:polyphosphate glucokinase